MDLSNRKIMLLGWTLAASMICALHGAASAADPAQPASCGVPVCDLGGEVARIRAMPQNERFKTVTGYRAAYKKNQDSVVLENLYEFGSQLEAMFTSVHEEDWLIREARGLSEDSLLGLAKYSSLRAPLIADYYSKIRGEAPRFEIINYWKGRIDAYEDGKSLTELADLFAALETISTRDQDPDYLAREAHGAANIVTQRFVQLYPYFEGVYDVMTGCTGPADGPTRPSYCGAGFVDRLTVMDTLDSGIEVSLSNHAMGTSLFTFSGAVLSRGGAVLEATGSPAGVLSTIHLEIDRDGGRVTGWLRNTDSLLTFEIQGSLRASPVTVFERQTANPNIQAVPTSVLDRTYVGTDGGQAVMLTLRRIGDHLVGGTLVFAAIPEQRVHFQAAKFFPERGILVLVGVQPNGSRVKMTLFLKLRTDGTRPAAEVSGMSFGNLSGEASDVALHPADGA